MKLFYIFFIFIFLCSSVYSQNTIIPDIPDVCGIDEYKDCPDGSSVITHLCENGTLIPTNDKCSTPIEIINQNKDNTSNTNNESCTEDFKETCFDGSRIIRKKCENGIYVETINLCPTPECMEDVLFECPDGSNIAIERCIGGRLKDTGAICPEVKGGLSLFSQLIIISILGGIIYYDKVKNKVNNSDEENEN